MPDANFMSSNIARYPKGSVIAAANDPNIKNMFFILQGSAGVYKNFKLGDEVMLKVLNKGDFWGEFALFLNVDYRESLVALADTVVLIITRRNLSEFLAAQPDVAVNIVENICRRLSVAETELLKLTGAHGKPEASRGSKIFPEGHGSYELPLTNENEVLQEESSTCPLCGHIFSILFLISSRLRLDRIDPDKRTRYKEIEPLYYEVITCPSCFYSAQSDRFSTVSKKLSDGVNKKIGPYKLDMYVKTGLERDTFTVFAGYYLAVLCAEVCFDQYQMIAAGLWQKISRLYQDAGDNNLLLYASQKSLDNYLYSYEHFNISPQHMPQYCYVIGDLYARTGDIENARKFFYMAKTNPAITQQLKRDADIRMEELKTLKKD